MIYSLVVEEEKFTPFLTDIEKYFTQSSDSIHKARNELKIIPYHDKQYVVKAFKVPNVINRFAYRFIRSSKAKRAYENALKIKSFTPKPIGYIEFYRFGLLAESYFVSEYFAYDFTIREPIEDKGFPDRKSILKAFGAFTYALHEAGIYHKDYSPGNVLVQKIKEAYHFQIVDINRMSFEKLDLNKRMLNFSKQGLCTDDLKIVISSYAKQVGIVSEKLLVQAKGFSELHQKRLLRKRALKKVYKR